MNDSHERFLQIQAIDQINYARMGIFFYFKCGRDIRDEKRKPSRAEAIHPCSRQFIRGYCRVTATMDRLEFAMRERKQRENLNDNN
jgi:hypothetical protein